MRGVRRGSEVGRQTAFRATTLKRNRRLVRHDLYRDAKRDVRHPLQLVFHPVALSSPLGFSHAYSQVDPTKPRSNSHPSEGRNPLRNELQRHRGREKIVWTTVLERERSEDSVGATRCGMLKRNSGAASGSSLERRVGLRVSSCSPGNPPPLVLRQALAGCLEGVTARERDYHPHGNGSYRA